MKTKILIPIIIGIAAIAGIAYVISKNVNANNKGSDIILFYKNGCVHCENVEKYINENNVEEKVVFKKLEVSGGKNAELMAEKARACGIQTDTIGVPFLWDGARCSMGDIDIIDFFKQKIQRGN